MTSTTGPIIHPGNLESDEADTAPDDTPEPSPADSDRHGGDRHADGGWDLVRAAQQGNRAAFGELYDRYVDAVYRYITFRINDRALAEDLTSEAFLRALRRISSVSYQGRDVGAWFITIARNLILDHLKSSRHRLEITTGDLAEPPRAGTILADPEQSVITRAITDELLECVRQLGPDQQECITLRFMHGLSVSETAQVMSRNEGAIKALQHRAVRRLAQLLPEGLR